MSGLPPGNFIEQLSDKEIYWRDRYDWLLESGYRLRPRYKPDWVPSWITNPQLFFVDCEDSLTNPRGIICDAIRLKDKSQVVLKRVNKTKHQNELDIHCYLSEKSDPKNHTVPLIEILNPEDCPSDSIVVMPQCRAWNTPEFETVGEVVDFIGQLFEGYKYLHENLVAHRDVKKENIVMESTALSEEHFHIFDQDFSLDLTKKVSPSKTRTEGKPRYYIIDFGISRHYEGTENPPYEITRMFGSDTSVPEFRNLEEPHNPFPIDVFCLGKMIYRKALCSKAETLGFEWLVPLLEDMTRTDPASRPTMEEVVTRYGELTRGLREGKLRSKFALDWDTMDWFDHATRVIPHWWKRMCFTVARTPAIPTYRPD
ncbi:hypothetical protein D9611_000730 [Ephemerocybe angulata]|uniref:Protein kinase domain-containing protein n=1 Tax=Ephemerocybe angulata TaxID=980116 RepID=A0A8H5F767_9AGAR|nr:hypothetical protein D9611_000730 [Tulosesus angulatus]